jgi:hypothetical protein
MDTVSMPLSARRRVIVARRSNMEEATGVVVKAVDEDGR